MGFSIIRNDLAKVKADAIVNTANPRPVVGSGTDYAIYEAAGREELLAARQKIGDIERGQAVETPAFRLSAKYIIHTVGPVWEGGASGEREILRTCYENALKLAIRLECRSIAFPLMASGSYGFPQNVALQVALEVLQSYAMEVPEMEITLVVFGKKALDLSGTVMGRVVEYVNEHYVEEARKREYPRRTLNGHIAASERRAEFARPAAETALEEAAAPPAEKARQKGWGKRLSDERIEELIRSTEKTEASFRDRLLEIIDSRKLTATEVYKGYVSKQVYSKIQGNPDYQPSKKTAVALCIALDLTIEETEDLIGRAGWKLSDSSREDLAYKGFIKVGLRDPYQINETMYDLGFENLCYF